MQRLEALVPLPCCCIQTATPPPLAERPLKV